VIDRDPSQLKEIRIPPSDRDPLHDGSLLVSGVRQHHVLESGVEAATKALQHGLLRRPGLVESEKECHTLKVIDPEQLLRGKHLAQQAIQLLEWADQLDVDANGTVFMYGQDEDRSRVADIEERGARMLKGGLPFRSGYPSELSWVNVNVPSQNGSCQTASANPPLSIEFPMKAVRTDSFRGNQYPIGIGPTAGFIKICSPNLRCSQHD